MARSKRNRALEAKREKEQAPLNRKDLLAKAAVMTGNAVDEASARQQIEQMEDMYGQHHACVPDYDPLSLLNYIELSPHVSPCIAAYAQNIEGYGHQSKTKEPWMADLQSEEAYEAVRQALLIEKWMDSEEEVLAAEAEKADILERIHELTEKRDDAIRHKRTTRTVLKWQKQIDEAQGEIATVEPDGEGDAAGEVTDEEVKAKLEEIDMQIRRETFIFDAFFKHCCSTMSFVKLRRITRQDYESHGWGCWEMLRDGYDRLKRLDYIPGFTVRPLVDPGDMIEVVEDDPVTPLSEDREISVKRRFRIYVQIVNTRKVYFKSPGDPRTISRATGKVYKSVQEMRRKKNEGKKAEPANELLWFAQHSPKTPCPPPRWIGNLLQVLGGREADETNYFYLRDNAIPYGLLFVTGGYLPTDIKERVEHRLTAEIRGSRGAGKVLVVQAKPMGKEPDGRSIIPSMEFQSLRAAHENDATFIKYDERGADRIGASFRLPPILRGYTPPTLNRATAMASVYVGEQQVFEPERGDVDWTVNKYILPDLGIRYLLFVSNSPPTRSVEDVAKIIDSAAPQGGLLPYEIRQLLGDLFNKPLAEVREEWVNSPMVMTIAGLAPTGEPASGTEPGDEFTEPGETVQDLAKKLTLLEARVRTVVQEELKVFGDFEVTARFMDEAPGSEGGEGGQ